MGHGLYVVRHDLVLYGSIYRSRTLERGIQHQQGWCQGLGRPAISGRPVLSRNAVVQDRTGLIDGLINMYFFSLVFV